MQSDYSGAFEKVRKNNIRYKNNAFKTSIKRISYVLRILRNKILRREEPVIVALTVNNACNLDCSYCFGSYSNRRAKDDFTTEELIKIIDELWHLGTRNLTVHGGETLLRKDIGYLVDYMKQKGFYVNLVTNGILFPQRYKEIRNVDSLCISLDGAEEGNDKNRGRGTYKKIIEAIRLAKVEGFRLRVQATLTKYTAGDVEFLAKLAQEIGFELEFSLLYKPSNYELEMAMDDDETKKAIQKIIEAKKKGSPIFTSYRVLYNAFDWPYSYKKSKLFKNELPKNFRKIDCYYGKTKMIIDADGFVYPCFPMIEEFKPLNIKEVGAEKAFEHVRETNPCVACCFLTNNDHNLLLGLSLRQIWDVGLKQIQEIFNLYHKK